MEFFFLPEHELPDEFFVTNAIETTFERDNFPQYRITMDDDGQWVEKILRIIQENPKSRQVSARPVRSQYQLSITDDDALSSKPAHVKAGAKELTSIDMFLGRQRYTEVLHNGHLRLYEKLMHQCAYR